MAKLPRATQKIFSSSTQEDVTAWGSINTNPTTDPDLLQGAGYLTGITAGEVSGKALIPEKDLAGLFNVLSRQLAYIYEAGIPEYDAGTTYYIGSVVRESSTTTAYSSITDDNLGNALTDTANWKLLGDLQQLKLAVNKNYTIDPNFEIWPEGTSITNTTGNDFYGSVLMGGNCGTGGSPSLTVSRQAFTLGQTDVPGNPKYFLRGDLTIAASTTQPYLYHKIESVRTNADGSITVTAYMKAGASINVDIDYVQNFGTTGSPSPDVVIVSQAQALTTSWVKITKTFVIPSISGKTLGTDDNDHLQLRIKYPLAATNIVDIVSLKQEEGSVSTALGVINIANELIKSERYFQKFTFRRLTVGVFQNGDTRSTHVLNNTLRGIPTMLIDGVAVKTSISAFGFTSSGAAFNGTVGDLTINEVSDSSFSWSLINLQYPLTINTGGHNNSIVMISLGSVPITADSRI